jgi:tagatose 1,6-diphosphate aldolase GatY/KbaY
VTLAVDSDALRAARAERRAIIGFSIYNLEQGLAVVRAAELERAAVILQAGSSAFTYAGREVLAEMAVALGRGTSAQIGVHLDHSTDLDEIRFCLDRGYTSVMFDGSGLPLEDNIERTAAVVRMAREAGAWVEAELAGVSGDEDNSTDVEAAAMTDPCAARQFVAATGVDALAVAIGNVHGVPARPVTLDLDRLSAIKAAVDVPLVLHGASGLPDARVRDAIGLGVAKVNVNTELRRALRTSLIAVADDPPAGDGIATLMADIIGSVQAAAQQKLRALNLSAVTTREGSI